MKRRCHRVVPPDNVTSVLRGLAAQMAKRKLEEWAAGVRILGELQNGFRKDVRYEKKLFVITRCIEIAVKSQRPLWLVCLDIEGAYDDVNHEKSGTSRISIN